MLEQAIIALEIQAGAQIVFFQAKILPPLVN